MKIAPEGPRPPSPHLCIDSNVVILREDADRDVDKIR